MEHRPTTALSVVSKTNNINISRPNTTMRRKVREKDRAREEAMSLTRNKSTAKALMLATRKKFERKIDRDVSFIRNASDRKLKPLGPIRPLQLPGKIVPKIDNKWWLNKPTKAGESCTKRQLDIANRVTEDRLHLLQELSGEDGGEGLRRDEGDLYADPHKVMQMLMSRSFAQLTDVHRAEDFKAEIGWRLGFRQFP